MKKDHWLFVVRWWLPERANRDQDIAGRTATQAGTSRNPLGALALSAALSTAAVFSMDTSQALASAESAWVLPEDNGATVVLDYDRVLTASQRNRVDAKIQALEQETGWKIRVVTKFGDQKEIAADDLCVYWTAPCITQICTVHISIASMHVRFAYTITHVFLYAGAQLLGTAEVLEGRFQVTYSHRGQQQRSDSIIRIFERCQAAAEQRLLPRAPGVPLITLIKTLNESPRAHAFCIQMRCALQLLAVSTIPAGLPTTVRLAEFLLLVHIPGDAQP
eukprot:587633-Prorocentrum_minimum.AAC.2